MDFTLRRYGEILDTFQAEGMKCYPVADWIRQLPQRGVLLRHDVDRLPGNALQMAKMEALKGIRSTYYFRIGKHTFKPAIIKAIADLGHEVGYHYEDLSLARGNKKKAIGLFEKHLNALRQITPIETIAMHGRPLSGYDNRDIWKDFDFTSFGIIGEAFLSVDYRTMFYFTDTGRSWSSEAVNLRDHVAAKKAEMVHSSEDLMNFIRNNKDACIALVAHPERWNDNLLKWNGYAVFDAGVNLIKRVLGHARRK